MPNLQPAPAERFAMLLLWLAKAVDARYLAGLLTSPQIVAIIKRLQAIRQSFDRLAARLAAGRRFPRRTTRRPPATRRQRTKNPLPQGPAWLLKLVPEAAASASQLQFLLVDPQFAAVVAAAPASFGRPLRSLCRMLGLPPPAILAPPPRVRPPRPPKPKRPRAEKRPKPEKIRYEFGLRYPNPFRHLL